MQVLLAFTIHSYSDKSPKREFGSLVNMPELEAFLYDADYDGRSLDSFMKDAATWASVFGHCWVMVAKPDIGATTRADELAQGVRPYLSLLTPLVVLDWQYGRAPSGKYQLNSFAMLKMSMVMCR